MIDHRTSYVLTDLLADEGVRDSEINDKIKAMTDEEMIQVYLRHGYDPDTETRMRPSALWRNW